MPIARKNQISLESTTFYHCAARCVRRAFLCGKDHFSGKNYEHRRQWIEDRLLELGSIFAIDIAAYAIMSNHYHVVLHVDKQQADNWSNKEICTRWAELFSGNDLAKRYLKNEILSAV
ncbi:MAG: transposase, partial [Gammaproteobacteria bacterium]|nr:transposase [Gammaproteobacteria bacterium]